MKKQTFIRTFSLLAFMLCLQMHALSMPDSLLFRKYAVLSGTERALIEELNKKSLEEGLDDVAKLESWAEAKGDYALRDFFSMLRYRFAINKKNKNNRFAEEGMLHLLHSLDPKNELLKANILSMLSSYYWDNDRFALGFEYGLLSYKIYSRYPISEYPRKGDDMHDLGGRHYIFKDFYNAKKYFLELYREDIGISSLNTLALCYSNLNMPDSALFYFNIGYDKAMKNKDEVWIGILSGNIGHLYYIQKDYSRARNFFETCVEKCVQNNITGNAANAMSVLGDVYYQLGEKTKASELAQRSYGIVSREYKDSYELIKNAYPKIAKVFAAFGRSEEAFRLMDSANMAKDSLNRRSNALIFAGVQHKLDAQDHLETQLQNEKEQNMSALVRNGLITGLILLGIIAALLINRQRLNYRHQQQQLEVEKLQTQAELLSATTQLQDFTRSITEKNELLEKFSAEIKRMQVQYGSMDYMNAPLMELERSGVLSDSDWERFQHSFDKVHHGFIKRLRQKVQGLSPVETRFMLLSRLRFSNREMAGALGISTEAARQNRERLRQKLQLPEEEHSLEEFAASI